MDATDRKEKKVNPAAKANFLSLLTFTYMFPIFKKGFKNELAEKDLTEPLKEHKSGTLGTKLEKNWREASTKHKKYALHIALLKLFGLKFFLFGILTLFNHVFMTVLPPFSIGRLMSYYEKTSDISETEAYLQALAIVLSLVVNAFLSHPILMGLMHITMKMRLSCSSLIYRKALKLNSVALADNTVGKMVNLLTNDVGIFEEGFLVAHYVWIGPIHAAVGTYFLYQQIGVSAFFGIALLISFIPIQLMLGKRTSTLRLRVATRTDERVRLVNEIISGIQVIKMYCWEKPFAKLMGSARKNEIKAIRDRAFVQSLLYSFETFVARVAIFISILGFVLFGSKITAEKVFTVKAIYDVLRTVLILHYSIAASSIAETNVALNRIQKFLSSEEHSPKDFQSTKEPKIVLKNVSAKWSKERENTLEQINLSLSSPEVIAIVGTVGSGKSSLFAAIVQEMYLESGSVEIAGKVSYSSQEPWLFSSTIRQNIIFNNAYEEDRYQKVLEACALKQDLKSFPSGDQTVVGERGCSLSGGQKTRINLARCLYNKADIYLLDDPLSAVDSNVGKHIFEKCVNQFLRGKICLLNTHQLQYLSKVDNVVIMRNGRIEKQEKYSQIKEKVDFSEILEVTDTDQEQNDEDNLETTNENQSVIKKEEIQEGKIKLTTYAEYFKVGGGVCMVTILALLFIFGQSVVSLGDYCMSYWVKLEQKSNSGNNTFDRDALIYTYFGLILATIVLSIIQAMFFMYFFTIASINLHKVAFAKLLEGTMKFFNANPSGRIVNRFSKDFGDIDNYIPSVLFDVIRMALMLVGSFVLSFIVDPWLCIPAVFLLLVFYFLRIVYIRTTRSIKRLEGVARSPIYGHMTTSVRGLSTVRVFSAEDKLVEEFDHHQDNHSSAWFLFIAANRCFGFWIDMLCVIFLAFAIFIIMYFTEDLYGSDMGLVITQYTTFISTLQWELRQLSELENSMISIERVLEYKNIEGDPDRRRPSKIPSDWFSEGKIEFHNLSLKYESQKAHILKNLSFTIQANEKVGVVGRTGAGKSSTVTALFQLYPVEGCLFLDNVNTTILPLHEVRSKISIIPQEPFLFSGNLRTNIDPFAEFCDATLWDALEQVQLKEVVASLPNGLDFKVVEGGNNFSVGQKQLICCARALIRRNKILVMDETTANVDLDTDSIIQKTVKEKFSNCTVVSIAHRLHTVMDYDKVLVMDDGCVADFDHPYVLLERKSGIFYEMVQSCGANAASNLENIAKESFIKKTK